MIVNWVASPGLPVSARKMTLSVIRNSSSFHITHLWRHPELVLHGCCLHTLILASVLGIGPAPLWFRMASLGWEWYSFVVMEGEQSQPPLSNHSITSSRDLQNPEWASHQWHGIFSQCWLDQWGTSTRFHYDKLCNKSTFPRSWLFKYAFLRQSNVNRDALSLMPSDVCLKQTEPSCPLNLV